MTEVLYKSPAVSNIFNEADQAIHNANANANDFSDKHHHRRLHNDNYTELNLNNPYLDYCKKPCNSTRSVKIINRSWADYSDDEFLANLPPLPPLPPEASSSTTELHQHINNNINNYNHNDYNSNNNYSQIQMQSLSSNSSSLLYGEHFYQFSSDRESDNHIIKPRLPNPCKLAMNSRPIDDDDSASTSNSITSIRKSKIGVIKQRPSNNYRRKSRKPRRNC